ncbi:MAG: PleD family two-component system response regulator [Kofleriaceae bacterium]
MSVEAPASWPSADGARQPNRQPVSVLVVDDDADIRETISEVLEDEGYSVVSAVNGADALEMLRSIEPSLILLDLSMPIMSGQEFRCRQLQDPMLASIPTVVMTAADRIYDKTAGMQLTEILAKPITLETLLASVERYQP